MAITYHNQKKVSVWLIRGINILGNALFIVGILCSMVFYSDFGVGGSAFLYAIMGLLLDASKKVMIIIFSLFLVSVEDNLTEIAICMITWFILTLLSLAAAIGFLSIITAEKEEAKLKASNAYERANADYESANANINSLLVYSSLNINSLETEKKALQAEHERLRTERSQCRKNYFTKCINPLTAKINEVNTSLHEVNEKINNHQSYLAALAAKKEAAETLTNINFSDTAIHPLFINLGEAWNQTPSSIKNGFILLTSIVVELLSSILFFLKERLASKFEIINPNKTYEGQYYTQQTENTQPCTAIEKQNTQPCTASRTPTTQSRSNNDTYNTIVGHIRNKTLTRASYRQLANKYGLNQTQATNVRAMLVDDGIAVMDGKGELVLTP